jgi:DNA helicase-2/ATP-dependent DNA helicase PcrA
MTLHQSKGLEFPVVFVPALEDNSLPHFHALCEGKEAVEEERRLLYVAVTRAKKRLFLTSSASRNDRSRNVSRFLREVPRTVWAAI